jgi:hypothetical protein
MKEHQQTNARRHLVGIIILFAMPVFLAYGLTLWGWQPKAQKNNGQLLNPAQDFRQTLAKSSTGEIVPWGDPSGDWHVLALMPEKAEDCSQACAIMIDSLQRIWLGLGRHANRVHVWYEGDLDSKGLAALAQFPQARVLAFQNRPFAKVGGSTTVDALLPFDVYVIDPHGYLILRYVAGSDPLGLRKDLKRLVR